MKVLSEETGLPGRAASPQRMRRAGGTALTRRMPSLLLVSRRSGLPGDGQRDAADAVVVTPAPGHALVGWRLGRLRRKEIRDERVEPSTVLKAVAVSLVGGALSEATGFIGGPILVMLFIGGTAGIAAYLLIPGLRTGSRPPRCSPPLSDRSLGLRSR